MNRVAQVVLGTAQVHQALKDLQSMSLSPAVSISLDESAGHTVVVHSVPIEGRNYGRDCLGGLNSLVVSTKIPPLAVGYTGDSSLKETAVTSGFYV